MIRRGEKQVPKGKKESREISRRDRLVGARAAAVAIPESKGYVVFDPELCTGCRTCELACSAFKNGGKFQPSLSRIQVVDDPFAGTIHAFEPKVCLQCQDPKCVTACPVEAAMYIDEKTGARCIKEDKCIGCKKCIKACGSYFEPPRIVFDPVRKLALKCDLCGGHPQCVKWCSNGALKYVGLSEIREGGEFSQEFTEPYTKDFGPDFTPHEGQKVTFKTAYPYLQNKNRKGRRIG